MWRRFPAGRAGVAFPAALAVVLSGFGDPALAQSGMEKSGGLYLGLSLPLGRLGATMEKAVDNTAPNTLVPEPRRGRVFHDRINGAGLAYGFAGNAGYRLPLSDNAYYVDVDAGIERHGGTLEAQFAGVGVSPERKQLGESWPDRWAVEKRWSYGATLRLGGDPGGLRAHDLGLYLMAGIRFIDVRLTSDFDGCFSPEPCHPTEFRSGTEVLDLDFLAWKSGVGMERRLGAGLVVRVEASYSFHAREDWVTLFEEVGVTVDSNIDANEAGLSLGLVRMF